MQEHRLHPSSSERLREALHAQPSARAVDDRPDWVQADPAWIQRALASSQRLPSGGWYVIDDRHAISGRPRCFSLNGRKLVVFRHASGFFAAPDACPHLGAPLAGGRAEGDRIVCPWHGLKLGPEGLGSWKPLPTYDDGVLLWVRDDGGAPATAAPILPLRPDRHIDAVTRVEAACEPRDVIANRLDPWHGVHFHPRSFRALRVIDQQADEITVRVGYRIFGPLGVDVDARFHCTDPRTIVMTIVRGQGEGSVVETHATPLAPGRTAIVEATLASSERPGFRAACRVAPLLRPLLKRASRRLWAEDAPYAERLYELRVGSTKAAP